MEHRGVPGPRVRRPAPLRPGDRVAVVSPSGPSEPARVARGVELLTSWGLEVVTAPDVYARHGYLGGTDAQRLDSLNRGLRDPAIRAVLCTRGGYGAQRIVDALDYPAVRADPKLVLGFSDITALHLGLWRAAGLATVHGPGVAWQDERTPAASAQALRRVLMTTEPVLLHPDPQVETSVLRTGRAPVTGTLLGGNLTLLAASVGTADQPALRGALLLIEDVAEYPYRVDRMLTQLLRSGALHGLAGVVVGDFTDCPGPEGPSVVEVLGDRLDGLGVPVVGGYRLGHGPGQLPVPLGVPATLDPVAGTLRVCAATREPDQPGQAPRCPDHGTASQ